MTQVGEGVAVTAIEEGKPGTLRVQVRDSIENKLISGAEVSVGSKTMITDNSGEVVFDNIPSGAVGVKAKKHFKDADYSKFIINYPRVMKKYEAVKQSLDSAVVKSGSTTKIRVNIDIYHVIESIVFHRKNIDLSGGDKYGHWWTVLGPKKSFGWWPKYRVGSQENFNNDQPQPPTPLPDKPSWQEQVTHTFNVARYNALNTVHNLREHSISQTFRGVEGELNGVTSFGGVAKNGVFIDPHHAGSDTGDEVYSPVTDVEFDIDSIESLAVKFSTAYEGGWSWRLELGNHCHTFQKHLMRKIGYSSYNVIK